MFYINREKIDILAKNITRPKVIINYIGTQIAYKLKLKKFPFFPATINIEPVNTCNFKCSHCQVTHWDKTKEYLTTSNFLEILSNFPSVVRIKLQGMGEPLLNKSLFQMLLLAEKKGVRTTLTSNASLLNKNKSTNLLDLENNRITFSLDGATADIFESIRIGSNFDKVCQNIKQFTTMLGAKRASKQTSAWMVITKQNQHQASEVVTLAKELGLGSITIQTFLNNWGKEKMNRYIQPKKVDFDSPDFDEIIDRARETAKQIGIDLDVHRDNYLTRKQTCQWPWKSSYVAVNGDVIPCSLLADADTAKMGNIFTEDFSEIWNSSQYQELRQRHKNKNIPEYCQQCYLNDCCDS